jgi:hypothetical protein
MTGMETSNVSSCNIDGEPFLGMCFLLQHKANGKATRLAHTGTRRTKCFVRVRCILEQIFFAMLSKWEVHFGRGLGYIPMNMGHSCPKTSRVIGITPLYKIFGASSNRSATNFFGEHVTNRKLSGHEVGELVRSLHLVAIRLSYGWSDICMTAIA